MFPNNKKNKILISILSVVTIYIITSSLIWQGIIINKLNKTLSESGIIITSVELSGNLLNNIKGRSLNIEHPSYGKVFVDNFLINIDYFSSFFEIASFDKIVVDGLLLDSTKYLKENTDVIQSIKLFQKVQSYVIDNADQTPNHSTIHGTGHDGGEFLFFPIS